MQNMTMAGKYPTTPKLGVLGLSFILLMGMVTMGNTSSPTGCSPSQVENQINVLSQQITGLLAVAEPGKAWVVDLQKELPLLAQTEASWKAGGSVQDVINVLNEIELIVAVVPSTAVYSPLIDLIVTGADMVLAKFLPTITPATPVTSSAKMGAMMVNVHRGRVQIRSASDSRSKWAAVVKGNPALAGAALK